jgi:hypothetical protein
MPHPGEPLGREGEGPAGHGRQAAFRAFRAFPGERAEPAERAEHDIGAAEPRRADAEAGIE